MDSHPMETDPRRKVADTIEDIFKSAINDESEMWNVVRLFYDSPESRAGLSSDEVLLYHRVKIYLNMCRELGYKSLIEGFDDIILKTSVGRDRKGGSEFFNAIKSIYSIDVDTDQRKSWFRRKER